MIIAVGVLDFDFLDLYATTCSSVSLLQQFSKSVFFTFSSSARSRATCCVLPYVLWKSVEFPVRFKDKRCFYSVWIMILRSISTYSFSTRLFTCAYIWLTNTLSFLHEVQDIHLFLITSRTLDLDSRLLLLRSRIKRLIMIPSSRVWKIWSSSYAE